MTEFQIIVWMDVTPYWNPGIYTCKSCMYRYLYIVISWTSIVLVGLSRQHVKDPIPDPDTDSFTHLHCGSDESFCFWSQGYTVLALRSMTLVLTHFFCNNFHLRSFRGIKFVDMLCIFIFTSHQVILKSKKGSFSRF